MIILIDIRNRKRNAYLFLLIGNKKYTKFDTTILTKF